MAAGDLTWDELNELTVTDLRKIMVYMNLPYETKMKKAELVQTIWANMPKDDAAVGETETPLPKMSVRLKRIYESLGRLP